MFNDQSKSINIDHIYALMSTFKVTTYLMTTFKFYPNNNNFTFRFQGDLFSCKFCHMSNLKILKTCRIFFFPLGMLSDHFTPL